MHANISLCSSSIDGRGCSCAKPMIGTVSFPDAAEAQKRSIQVLKNQEYESICLQVSCQIREAMEKGEMKVDVKCKLGTRTSSYCSTTAEDILRNVYPQLLSAGYVLTPPAIDAKNNTLSFLLSWCSASSAANSSTVLTHPLSSNEICISIQGLGGGGGVTNQ